MLCFPRPLQTPSAVVRQDERGTCGRDETRALCNPPSRVDRREQGQGSAPPRKLAWPVEIHGSSAARHAPHLVLSRSGAIAPMATLSTAACASHPPLPARRRRRARDSMRTTAASRGRAHYRHVPLPPLSSALCPLPSALCPLFAAALTVTQTFLHRSDRTHARPLVLTSPGRVHLSAVGPSKPTSWWCALPLDLAQPTSSSPVLRAFAMSAP